MHQRRQDVGTKIQKKVQVWIKRRRLKEQQAWFGAGFFREESPEMIWLLQVASLTKNFHFEHFLTFVQRAFSHRRGFFSCYQVGAIGVN